MSINLYEFKKELRYWGIECVIKDWYIDLIGGDSRARQHYKEALIEDENLQAMLIIDAAKKDKDIEDVIEERAAIRWVEGVPYDLLSAAKCHLRGVKE